MRRGWTGGERGGEVAIGGGIWVRLEICRGGGGEGVKRATSDEDGVVDWGNSVAPGRAASRRGFVLQICRHGARARGEVTAKARRREGRREEEVEGTNWRPRMAFLRITGGGAPWRH